MSTGGSHDRSTNTTNATNATKDVDGKKEKVKVVFNLKGQVIAGKNPFKARGLELVKTHVGLAFDDWRHVPDAKKVDMFETLLVLFSALVNSFTNSFCIFCIQHFLHFLPRVFFTICS